MSEREKRLDEIRKYAERLNDLAKAYDRLRWLAEKEDATDMLLAMAIAAGSLTTCSLGQLGRLMEMLWGTQKAEELK